MRYTHQIFHREAGNASEAQGGTATAATLFDQFAGDKKKALDTENRLIVKDDIKMRFHGSINTAKGNIARKRSAINAELSELQAMNFQRVIDLEAEIAAEERNIAAAQKYYQVLFGATMPTQSL